MPADERPIVALGMPSARDLLAMPGVVVSGHIGRNVSRVLFGDEVAFLKREHRVRWRDRFRNMLAGFGRASISEREYQVIRRLREHGLPAPQLLANGEADGQAFLLLAEAEGAVELRKLLHVDQVFAANLGRIVARIHNVGVDQPDLFAKHFLINPATSQVTILDWQRATLCDIVPRRNRIRSLAALRATCSDTLLPPAAWRAFLNAYAQTARIEDARLEVDIEAEARRLRRRPSIRSQIVAPTNEQELVRIAGETICAIPSLANELDSPDAIESLYAIANCGRTIVVDGRKGVLHVAEYPFPMSRLWSAARGKSWRSAELKQARLYFQLERYGIIAPKLLAYGQRVVSPFQAGAFVLTEAVECESPTANDADRLRELLDRLHSTGCHLRGIGRNGEPIGMMAGEAMIRSIDRLKLNRRISSRQMARDRARLDAWLEGAR